MIPRLKKDAYLDIYSEKERTLARYLTITYIVILIVSAYTTFLFINASDDPLHRDRATLAIMLTMVSIIFTSISLASLCTHLSDVYGSKKFLCDVQTLNILVATFYTLLPSKKLRAYVERLTSERILVVREKRVIDFITHVKNRFPDAYTEDELKTLSYSYDYLMSILSKSLVIKRLDSSAITYCAYIADVEGFIGQPKELYDYFIDFSTKVHDMQMYECLQASLHPYTPIESLTYAVECDLVSVLYRKIKSIHVDLEPNCPKELTAIESALADLADRIRTQA